MPWPSFASLLGEGRLLGNDPGAPPEDAKLGAHAQPPRATRVLARRSSSARTRDLGDKDDLRTAIADHLIDGTILPAGARRLPDRCTLAMWPHPVVHGERCPTRWVVKGVDWCSWAVLAERETEALGGLLARAAEGYGGAL